MAKAKPQRKPPSGQPAAKPATAKPAFDTTLAAESAAAMIGKRTTPIGGSAPRKETAAFRQLKEGLNLPAELSIGKLLDKTGNPTAKKSAQPFGSNKGQVGHNQTFGADATKSGVPRRTGG